MGLRNGSLDESFVTADWIVNVYELFGILDGPSDHLPVQTIPIYGCMDRRSCYSHAYF